MEVPGASGSPVATVRPVASQIPVARESYEAMECPGASESPVAMVGPVRVSLQEPCPVAMECFEARVRCLDDPSTDKPTTRHFDPNEASTQRTVCCDNLLL
jgi:hypothetical protein